MNKISRIIILSVLLTFTIVQNAMAYTTTGKKWADSKTPRYYFTASFPSNLQTAANNASAEWRFASSKLGIALSSSGTVAMVATSSSSSISGWTELTRNLGGLGSTIIGGRITINTYYTNSYTSTQRTSLVGHEFGHIYGLGESGDVWALMYPSDSERSYRGTYFSRADDKNGINYIYP